MITSPWAARRRATGFSQQRVAGYLGVSRHMVLRMEQGLFSDPPHVQELAILYDSDASTLNMEYHEYVARQREQFAQQHPDFRTVLKNYTDIEHPLVHYREVIGVSQIGFCRGLCLHPDPVRDYEMQAQRGIPKQLIVACNAISWDYGYLESAVLDWKITGRANEYAAL